MLAILGVMVVMIGVVWLGFQIPARPFPIVEQKSRDSGKVRAPQNLPQPVCRFMQTLFADEIPVVDSAIISGRVRVRIAGLSLPARFRIYHNVGRDYYHQIEITWFGFPVMSVHERFLDGKTLMKIPGNLIDNDPHTNAAALQGLWSESVWIPMIYFTDPRVHWEAIDANTARLIIPGAAPEENFTVGFDPKTGMLATFTTQRYQQPGDSPHLLWRTRGFEWAKFNGIPVPVISDIRWDNDKPWAVWHVEDVRYNVDVSQRFAHFGV